jgi:hypothetical protein
MRRPLVRVAPADVGERTRRLQAWRRQPDMLERHRPLDLAGGEPEVVPDAGGGMLDLGVGRLLVLEAPTPVLAPPRRDHGGVASQGWPASFAAGGSTTPPAGYS